MRQKQPQTMHAPFSRLSAVILAGGQGKRLRPVIGERQKVIAPVHGRPFLYFLLDRLQVAGIRTVVLCIGYDAQSVQDQLGTRYGSLRLHYSQETHPMGTAGALRLALPLIESDPMLVMNGDSISMVDFAAFYQWHCQQRATASLLLTPVLSDSSRYGQVVIDQGGRICSFAEKNNKIASGWISAGVYILSRQVVAEIPSGRAVSIEHEVFPRLIGRAFYGYRGNGRFIDIGTPASFAAAADVILIKD